MDKNESYVYGFICCDGSLYETTRNRGKISIEINIRDSDIIYKINNILNNIGHISTRKRITNFGNSETMTLNVYNLALRNRYKSYGLIAGKKIQRLPLLYANILK